MVTQVLPGPVDSEFDQAAGSTGGMSGGPPQWLRISPGRCAREALAGFDRGTALVFPGRGYRLLMHLLPLLSRAAGRRRAARTALPLRKQRPTARTGHLPGDRHGNPHRDPHRGQLAGCSTNVRAGQAGRSRT